MALKLKGSTSGFVAIDAPSVAGNNTLILPENTGSAHQILANDITAGVTTFTQVTVSRNGDLTVPGTISIGGTLTYEDVTSVDSVGIVTARGLSIFGNTTGLNVASGISTFSDVSARNITGAAVTFSGIAQAAQFKLLDNAKALYGDSGDLQIYHSTNSLIQNGTGALQIITTTGDLFLRGQDNITFNTAGNNERVRIDSNGNLGLGDNGPTNFTNYTNLSIHGTTGGAITFGDDGTDEWEIYAGDGALRVYDRANTTERLRITDGGNIGIGENSPACRLDIEDNASGGDGITEILRLNGSPNNLNDGIKINFARAGSSCGHIVLEKVNNNNTTDLIVSTRSSNTVSESVRITGAGKVGINTSVPNQLIDVYTNATNADAKARICSANGGQAGLELIAGSGSVDRASRIDFINMNDSASPQWTLINDYQQTGTNDFGIYHGAEKAIVANPDSGVELYFNGAKKLKTINEGIKLTELQVAPGGTETASFMVFGGGGLTTNSVSYGHFYDRVTAGGNNTAVVFRTSGTSVGQIIFNNSNTLYQTSSDYRLKENAVSISDGITRLKTLKPYRFNFKVDPDKTVDGFFAHEVTAVPEAISGTKDEVDSDNNPVYQGIDQSKLVPLLTAALQEAIAKIETLEAKVAALEGS